MRCRLACRHDEIYQDTLNRYRYLTFKFKEVRDTIMWKSIALAVALLASGTCQAVTVVEYYNSTIDAYFITGRTNEQTALDTVSSFRRTGMTFQAASGTDTTGTYTRICRFYISLANPYTSSHFYGKEGVDCESILAMNLPGFSWDGYDFSVAKLNADNTCPAGNAPLFRGFRVAANGKTPNHRYYASRASCDAGSAAGYACEGQVFCGGSSVAPPTNGVVRTYRGSFSGSQQDVAFSGTVTWSLQENEIGPNGESTYRISAANANITSTFTDCTSPGAVALDTTTAWLSVTPSTTSASVSYGGLLRSIPAPITCAGPPEVTVPFGYIWLTCQADNNVLQNQTSTNGAQLQGSCNSNDGASFSWDFQAVN